VDRLTRSLADFAKIIESFDLHKVSFVSVTQQFNTTTSMGRLTLNVLLSFAQFERELTGERIRDKIAASKKKGMWMGGVVPLGYDVKHRKLEVNPFEADDVRKIFRLYLKLGCVSRLKVYLENTNARSKKRLSALGHQSGGATYSRGALYSILRNRTYIGEIQHKENVYRAEHVGIVPRVLWERAQKQLEDNRAHRNVTRVTTPSLLVGLIYDDAGNRFTPTHALKKGKRYRYYVSQRTIKNPGHRYPGLTRIPAVELDELVRSELISYLEAPYRMLQSLEANQESADTTARILSAAAEQSKLLKDSSSRRVQPVIRRVVSRVVIKTDSVNLVLNRVAMGQMLLGPSWNSPKCKKSHIWLKIDRPFQKTGGQTRVTVSESAAPVTSRPSSSLTKAIARAWGWRDRLMRGEAANLASIATHTGFNESYIRRLFPIAFLAPDIVVKVLEGRQPATLTLSKFNRNFPSNWEEQRKVLGFPSV
jgi:site-specific DNA recombinase